MGGIPVRVLRTVKVFPSSSRNVSTTWFFTYENWLPPLLPSNNFCFCDPVVLISSSLSQKLELN